MMRISLPGGGEFAVIEPLDRRQGFPAAKHKRTWALTDLIDTRRSLRLEQMIVILIVLEVVFSVYQIFGHR